MTLALTFLLTFTAGPAVFWALARRQPARGYALQLCLLAIGLIVAAYALSILGAPGIPDDPYAGLAAIMALWLAWIIVLALIMLALRRRLLPIQTQRVAFALCALATTLPWFGLAAAQMMMAA